NTSVFKQGGPLLPRLRSPLPGPLSSPSCDANQVRKVVIRARENGTGHLAPPARQSILENRRGSPVDKPASVLLTHPIQRAEPWFVKPTARDGEASSIVGLRSVLDRTLLLEEPRELIDIVETKRLRQFLASSGIECGSRLHQVARYEQAHFPASESAKQFDVPVQEGAEVDRCSAVHEVQ